MDTWLLRDVTLAMGAALLGGVLTLLLRFLGDRLHVKREQSEISQTAATSVRPRPPGLSHFLAATATATAHSDTVILAATAPLAAANRPVIAAPTPSAEPANTSAEAVPVAEPTVLAPSSSTVAPATPSATPESNPQPDSISRRISAPSLTLPLDLPKTIVTVIDNDAPYRAGTPSVAIPPPPPPTQTDLAAAAERLTRYQVLDPIAQLRTPVPQPTVERTIGPDLPQVRQHDPGDVLGTGPSFARPTLIWRPPTTRFLSSLVSEPSPVQPVEAWPTVATSTVN